MSGSELMRETVRELSRASSSSGTPQQTIVEAPSRAETPIVPSKTASNETVLKDEDHTMNKSTTDDSSSTSNVIEKKELRSNHITPEPVKQEQQQQSTRKLYHPETFLSQSTGQEVPIRRAQSSSSSMIFQQSGLNLNMHRMSTTSQSMMHSNSASSNNQHGIERQPSYLSFHAPNRTASNNKLPSLMQQRLPAQNHNQIPSPKMQHTLSTPPEPAKSVGDPDDDMDFSSFLNASQPQVSSRTQQKLWLQRETIASLNDTSQQMSASPISNISTRFKYEEVARSYMHVRRTENPVVDSLKRLDSLGPNHVKLRKSIGSNMKDMVIEDKFDADLSKADELANSVWKRSLETFISTPKKLNKQVQNLSSQQPSLSSSASANVPASELFRMGQRSFGSQQNIQPSFRNAH